MSISAPANGIRFVLKRSDSESNEERVVYVGDAVSREGSVRLRMRVDLKLGVVEPLPCFEGSGATDIAMTVPSELNGVPRPSVAPCVKAAAALVRSATKSAVAEAKPLPRKIVRWRPST